MEPWGRFLASTLALFRGKRMSHSPSNQIQHDRLRTIYVMVVPPSADLRNCFRPACHDCTIILALSQVLSGGQEFSTCSHISNPENGNEEPNRVDGRHNNVSNLGHRSRWFMLLHVGWQLLAKDSQHGICCYLFCLGLLAMIG